MKAAATLDLGQPVLTPASMVPRRTVVMAEQRNPDFVICEAAGQRVLRAALVHLIDGDVAYKQVALAQMASLFDDEEWPQWLDQAHHRFGYPAGLRTGMLARDVGLAYDWLYPSMTPAERQFVLDGLDRKAIKPYLASLKMDPWWIHDMNNWLTTIVGGLGIAGMAILGDHPDAQTLIDQAKPLMTAYLDIYGPEGEFSESVAYANATQRPANFFGALRYASGGGENKLAGWPFQDTCLWTMYLTLPPGRIAAFGDGHADAKPWIKHVAAIAAATGDQILQWFYLQHATESADPLELLWYDANLEPQDPQGTLPLGRAFLAHGGCISSRTDWHQTSTPCVVYGKFGREQNHEHNDIGQLCIDGFGERLIIDPGSPSGYPEDFFDEHRWRYYNASVRGHNVFMFGDREMRVPDRTRAQKEGRDLNPYRGSLLDAAFDELRGGFWKMDLTNAYDGAVSVKRTVVHLFPGIVAVLDEAELDAPELISMRWHTIEQVAPDEAGRFTFTKGPARLTARMMRLDEGGIVLSGGHHRYEPPYDRERTGAKLEQRHEPFVEALIEGQQCRLLSLFAVSEASEQSAWITHQGGWQIETDKGLVQVGIEGAKLTVKNVDTNLSWPP